MFQAARMTRVLIGGHKSHMQEVIDVLHKERVMHLEDYRDPTGTTGIGTPLEEGEQASDLLVRVRGLLRALDAEDTPRKQLATADAASMVADADAELSPVVREAVQLRSDIARLDAEAEHLAPFAGIDVDLAVLLDLQTVQGYMGSVKSDPRPGLDAAGVRYEIGLDGAVAILAVARADVEKADAVLVEAGFTGAAVPEGAQGTPARHIQHLRNERQRAQERLERTEQRIASQREQWAPRLGALEGYLTTVVERTQAPLSFAVTQTTFHAEGWIPARRANRVQNALSARFGESVYFENMGDAPRTAEQATTGAHNLHGDHDDAHHASPKDEAPIKLENKGLAKPFEFMLGLLGRPRYQEIDPTKLMLIFFPLFFGLMVGDFLLGLVIMVFGLYLKKNHIFGIGGPSVGRALIMGGFMATLVGLLVFGEALGIHFVVGNEALEEGELSWEAIIYGKDEVLHGEAGFPHDGFFRKVEGAHGAHGELAGDGTNNTTTDGGTNGTTALGASPDQPAAFAALAEETEEHGGILTPHGTTHLNAGPVQLGYYSKIHDIQALLIWSILIAFVHLNLAFLIGIRNVWVGHGAVLAIQEKVSWITLQVGAGIAIWGAALDGPSWATPAGVGLAVVSIGLLWVGVQKALGAPGFVAVIEVLGFSGNILSYTRLAAIGASKAGMALAFAAIGFEVIGGGDLRSVAGWAVYLLGMVVITLLAILSGGLQSLRLQFVEFFQKFYEGGGRPYVPFGRRAP